LDLGFGFWILGYRFRVSTASSSNISGFKFGILSLGCGGLGMACRGKGSWLISYRLWVLGFGLRMWDVGCGVCSLGLRFKGGELRKGLGFKV